MTSKEQTATRASARSKPLPSAPVATRITRAKALAAKPAIDTPPRPTKKKPAARKPLVSRDNTVAFIPASKSPLKSANGRKAVNSPVLPSDADREPIMAYLRIRPHLGLDQPTSLPYLTPLSHTSVRMTDPESQSGKSRFRSSTLAPSLYTFSHVFPPQTSQSEFFSKTTLPLVRDILSGQNALLFTYGVTNSGKTYTVQGESKHGNAGILPRTLDVIFNSIDGMHGDGRYRPVRLHGIELADPSDSKPPQITPEPALAQVFGQNLDHPSPIPDADIDPTVLKLDRNYEYTIWLSYAEVYNEKVYDLLASAKDDSKNGNTVPRSTTENPLLLFRKALPLKPSPPSDNADSLTTGKYISGLRQFRVHSASQAKSLVKLGQLHRRVFGTLANRESSRSHGMVIIKVVRGHKGERNDPTALQISRLTLVDLAGSERTKHTQTTGDRLKEAGNINKSLMVLGQCMEVMRTNQRKLAASLAQESSASGGRVDTRDVKKGLALVPFRHSKLTEVLMDYFVGDGRVVMIVNVNPYDTGYDENSHVMKFAALAREVFTTPVPAPLRRLPPGPGPGKTHGKQIKELGPMTLRDPDIAPLPYRRKVTIETPAGRGRRASEAVLEVLEEDEGDEGEEDEPVNPLVDVLFDEVEELRIQLFESEMRCAIIEAETREEVMREMEERMRSMEKMYARRLMNEVEQNEMKTDAKIDMLHQSGLFGSPTKKRVYRPANATNNLSEEQDVEMSLTEYGEDNDSEPSLVASGEEFDFESDGDSASARSRSRSKSPLAGKSTAQAKAGNDKGNTPRVIRHYVPDGPEAVILPSDDEEAELTETDEGDGGDGGESEIGTGTDGSQVGEDDYDEDEYDDDDDDDWGASLSRTPKTKSKVRRSPISQVKGRQHARKSPTNMTSLSKLEREMSTLSVGTADESMIVPVKKFRPAQQSVTSGEVIEEPEVSTLKKKKRQLGKKPVVTEDQIERITVAMDRRVVKNENGTIRRMIGR